MRRIFTQGLVALSALLFSASAANAQTPTCATITPTNVTITEDFSGSQLLNPGSWHSPDNTYDPTVTQGYLESTSAPGIKTLVTPTFVSGMAPIGIRFTLATIGGGSTTTLTVRVITASNLSNPELVCTFTLSSTNNATIYAFTLPTITESGFDYQNQPFRYQFEIGLAGNNNPRVRFDDFGILDAGNSPAVLPVKFESFSARKANNVVNLTWAISAEEGITDYLVERSGDGRTFSTIGSVKAGATQYNFTDAKMLGGSSYYRIKAIEPNAAPTFSKIVMVNGDAIGSIKTFPMPVRNNLTVEHGVVEGGVITLISESGRIISSVRVAPGTSQTGLDMTAATPGMYVVRVSDANGNISTSKVVKQ